MESCVKEEEQENELKYCRRTREKKNSGRTGRKKQTAEKFIRRVIGNP